MVSLLVVHLLLSCCPATIGRSVVLVDVDAVERMFGGWFSAHILQEILVRFEPALANADSAPTVMLKPVVAGILASCFHVGPSNPLRGFGTVPSVPVLRVIENLAPMTSAACGVSTLEMSSNDDFYRTAIAPDSVKAFEV